MGLHTPLHINCGVDGIAERVAERVPFPVCNEAKSTIAKLIPQPVYLRDEFDTLPASKSMISLRFRSEATPRLLCYNLWNPRSWIWSDICQTVLMYPQEFVYEGDQPLQLKQNLAGCSKMRISFPSQRGRKAHILEGVGSLDQMTVCWVYQSMALHCLPAVAGVLIQQFLLWVAKPKRPVLYLKEPQSLRRTHLFQLYLTFHNEASSKSLNHVS